MNGTTDPVVFTETVFDLVVAMLPPMVVLAMVAGCLQMLHARGPRRRSGQRGGLGPLRREFPECVEFDKQRGRW